MLEFHGDMTFHTFTNFDHEPRESFQPCEDALGQGWKAFLKYV